MEKNSYPENSQDQTKVNLGDITRKLHQSLKDIIEKEGFIESHINKKCLSTNGGNFLGTLYEIDVTEKTKTEDKELNIFVKTMPNPETFKLLSVEGVFNTELFAYKELSKIFDELQEEANVPSKERFKMVKVYEECFLKNFPLLLILDCCPESIIMENISKRGFTTYYRMNTVPLEFVEIAVQNLARFHGVSFALKEKRPEYFDKTVKHMNYPLIFKDFWKDFVKKMRDATIEHVDEKYKDKVEKVYVEMVDKYARNFNDETIQACLCHGDYKPNNIMTRIENGAIQEVLAIDYQLLHYSCPVFDLIYLIYFCTDRDFRKAHMTNIKNLYYETLEEYLTHFNIEVNVIYPRKDFEKVFKERLDHGLMSALFLFPFLFAPESDAPDLTKEVSNHSFPVDARFKDRINGVIEDFVELGFM